MQYRRDIEGLRGVAVLLVILFHVGLVSFSGGYVGVDVFFVISGFLITGQLVRQIDARSQVQLVDFWARRLRRLMPLLVVTVVATLAAGMFIYSPLYWQQLAGDARWSIGYLSNIKFARESSFYFQSEATPLLHTWSLSVEEQFYVLWPVAIGLVAVIGRVINRRPSTFVAGLLLVATAASFALSLLLTVRGTPWAFYSAPTRAWEFGLGGLTFMASQRKAWARIEGLSDVAVGAGLAAILWSAVSFDEFTRFPGWSAMVPAVGTCLVIAGGGRSEGRRIGALLANRPLMSLGRVSYAWYLFHWPAIVLSAAAIQRSSVAVAGIAAVASLLCAYAATAYIERPIRTSAILQRPWLSIGAAACSITLVTGLAFGADARAAVEKRDPYLVRLVEARQGRSESASSDCVIQTLANGGQACVHGDPTGAVTVVVVGDSHAAQWSPALERAARNLGIRLIVRARGGCPAPNLAVARTGYKAVSDACISFRAETNELIAKERPSAVVVVGSDYRSRILGGTGSFLSESEALEAAGVAAREFAESVVLPAGANLLVIENNPVQEREPVECLGRTRSAEQCSLAADEALPQVEDLAFAEQSAYADVMEIDVLNVAPMICDATLCWVERDGVIVYSDRDHLSAEFVLSQASDVEAFLAHSTGVLRP